MSVTMIAAPVAALLGFLLLYQDVIAGLMSDWNNDENYSHGFFIVPLALYFAWQERHRLLTAPVRHSWFGFVVLIGCIGMLIAGILGAEMFLTRISLIGTIAGGVLFVLGWNHLRILAFPIAFLILMVPIPTIIFNQIAFPLQLQASRFGESVLAALSIPVLREGNIIVLAHTTLEVAEACSGIRSLVSLLTLGVVLGYFTDRDGTGFRTALALATVPVAIAANGIRVAGTGIAAHYYGAAAADGFLHTFSGWLVFIVAFMMLLAVQTLFLWIRRLRLEGRRNNAPIPATLVTGDNR